MRESEHPAELLPVPAGAPGVAGTGMLPHRGIGSHGLEMALVDRAHP